MGLCVGCRFWECLEADQAPQQVWETEGYCHLNPPIVREKNESRYQVTGAQDWCSHFQHTVLASEERRPLTTTRFASMPGSIDGPNDDGLARGDRVPLDVISPRDAGVRVGKVSLRPDRK